MEKKFELLRKRIKNSQRFVMDAVIENHNVDMCFLCGSVKEITREHIIPQWAFESNHEKGLVNKKNNQTVNYIKATIPACKECNSELLGAFEDNLKRVLLHKKGDELTPKDLDCIIWWLQYLGFKLQLMDLRSRFLRFKNKDYIPYLSQIPIAMFWGGIDTTPNKVFRIVRRSRRALMTKKKNAKHNSLGVFETSNKHFHFFHKVDEFIFIELPQVQKAFFFFYNKEFQNHLESHIERMDVIKKFY
ncbi:hypothetical protein N5934_16960 [Enterobacter hormaechei]|uniref:hypothetical protein n=1 Tax=Enterobacter hormaechei TaxID=158836 RepID=UPI0021C24893|nr:hypothetical protein [Enterobacter hormaechei]UXI61296.1 hypothetical protein N5934_16960 [Enterobacter hormaechei]HEM8148837.1 hypothetical protein [Enterobacter hormaechei]